MTITFTDTQGTVLLARSVRECNMRLEHSVATRLASKHLQPIHWMDADGVEHIAHPESR